MNGTPPPAAASPLPTTLQQYAGRHSYRYHFAQSRLIMLAMCGLLWGSTWMALEAVATTQPLPMMEQAPPALAVIPFQPPAVKLALVNTPPATKALRERDRQRVRTDLLTLFGHVAQALLRDEFDSMVLRLSLGQQVAVHLQQDLLPE